MFAYIPAFIGALLLYYFHIIGMDRGIYDAVTYFDIGMHFFGGMVIGTFMYAMIKDIRKAFLIALIPVLGWEIFEYVFDIAVMQDQSYWSDTILDIVMGILGIVLAIDLSRKAFGSRIIRIIGGDK